MTDYNIIPDASLEPDDPITADLGVRWRDNPIAMFEGAPGAPRLDKKALGGNVLGVIPQVGGSGWSGITGIGDYAEVRADFYGASIGSGTTYDVYIRFTANNGTTWGSSQTLIATTGLTPQMFGFGSANINLVTGAVAVAMGVNTNGASQAFTNLATLTVPANCNGFQIQTNGSDGISALVTATSGRP